MNQQQFFDYLEKFFIEGLELIKKKNADYAKSEASPFSNFQFASLIGVTPEKAILIRVADKLSRVANLLERTNAVKTENIEDSLLDMCNYLAILSALLESKKNNKSV